MLPEPFILVNQSHRHLVITTPGLFPSLLSACSQARLSSETSLLLPDFGPSIRALAHRQFRCSTATPASPCLETFLSLTLQNVSLLLPLGGTIYLFHCFTFPFKNEIKILRKYTFFCETCHFRNSVNCNQMQL